MNSEQRIMNSEQRIMNSEQRIVDNKVSLLVFHSIIYFFSIV